MSSPFLILRIRPVDIDAQSGFIPRPRRHLTGGLVRFLRLGILRLGVQSEEPIVAIPVRANVGRDGTSDGFETIGDKVPVTAVRIDKAPQKLIVLWCPKLVGNM